VGATRAALDDAEAVIADCRAAHRIWMLESAVGLLAIAGSRSGLHREVQDVLARVAADQPPRALAAAHLSLAEGDADGALEEARRVQGLLTKRGLVLLAADAGELVALCLARLQRWGAAHDEADRQIAFCEASGYRNLHWRLLSIRAEAYAGLNDPASADRDRVAAASMVDALAATMPNAELRDAFLSQPAAAGLRTVAEGA